MRSRITSITVVANVGSVAFTAGVGLIVARLLGPEDRGELAVAFNWFLLALSLGEMTVSNSVVYFASRYPHARDLVVRKLRRMALLLAIPASVSLVLVAILADAGSSSSWLLLGLAALLPVAMQVTIPVFATLSVDSAAWNLLRLVQPLAYAALLLGAFVITGHLNLPSVYCAYSFSVVIQAVTATRFWGKVRHSYAPEASDGDQSCPEYSQLLRYGWYNALGGIPKSISARAPLIVLPAWVASDQIGVFAVAASVTALIPPATIAVGQLALPDLAASRDDPGRSRIARTAIARGQWISLFCALATAVGGFLLLPTILGSEYQGVGGLAALLCIPTTLVAIGSVYHLVLRGYGAQAKSALPQWLGLVGLLVGMVWLGPMHGVLGVSIAMSLGALVQLLGYALVTRKMLDSP